MKPPEEFQGRVDVLTGWAEEAIERGQHLIYVRIPVGLQPLERADRFEDPLQAKLSEAGLGEVAGGGSQLGEGSTILYCGVDININDRERGLALVRSTMRELCAPPGTVIEEFLPEWRELPL
jgi:hypothetical protein